MTNDQIKDIALANGFKLKEQPDGVMGLNPYVYEFAKALVATALLDEISEHNASYRAVTSTSRTYKRYAIRVLQQ